MEDNPTYKLQFLGNKKVKINGNYVHELDSFKQFCDDMDKLQTHRIFNRYCGE